MIYIHLIDFINANAQSEIMNYDNKRVAGLLFIVAAVQYVLAIVVSEAVYPGYSVGQQWMSDLGDWSKAGNYAAIFNISAILYGLFIIAGAYYTQRVVKNRLFTFLLAMCGIGSVFSGVVALNVSYLVHGFFGLFTFVFGAASAVMSYRFEKKPLSYVSVVLGAVAFSAIVFTALGQRGIGSYLGLGLGSMELLIIYPLLLCLFGYGAYLIGDSSETP